MGLFRHGTLWLGKAGMEGHRVVRLDVVCYVIVGLGVSGFAWFGSVGLAGYGTVGFVSLRLGGVWLGRQGAVCRVMACPVVVRRAWFVVVRFGKLRQVMVWSGRRGALGCGLVGFGSVRHGGARQAKARKEKERSW